MLIRHKKGPPVQERPFHGIVLMQSLENIFEGVVRLS